MKKMIKLLSLAMILGLVASASLTSCGETEAEKKEGTEESKGAAGSEAEEGEDKCDAGHEHEDTDKCDAGDTTETSEAAEEHPCENGKCSGGE